MHVIGMYARVCVCACMWWVYCAMGYVFLALCLYLYGWLVAWLLYSLTGFLLIFIALHFSTSLIGEYDALPSIDWIIVDQLKVFLFMNRCVWATFRFLPLSFHIWSFWLRFVRWLRAQSKIDISIHFIVPLDHAIVLTSAGKLNRLLYVTFCAFLSDWGVLCPVHKIQISQFTNKNVIRRMIRFTRCLCLISISRVSTDFFQFSNHDL